MTWDIDYQEAQDMLFLAEQEAAAAIEPVIEDGPDPLTLYCTQPIRMQRPEIDGDGDITDGLDEITVDCGTRFQADCPHCAEIYAKRTHIIISSGLPTNVFDSAAFLLTLTAPSFGPVHRPAWTKKAKHNAQKQRRKVYETRCPCGHKHTPGTDSANHFVGAPLDPATYDYTGQVAFNRISVKLFDSLKRSMKHEFPDFDLQHMRIAEPQRRGAVHFHTVLVFRSPVCDKDCDTPLPRQTVSCPHHPVLEFDSTLKKSIEKRILALIPRPCPSDCTTKPKTTEDTCPEHQRASHYDAQTNRTYRFGITKDLRPLTADKDDFGNPSWASTAAYLSKYLTKSSGGEDLDNKINWASPVGKHIDLMKRLSLEQKLVALLAANKPVQIKRLTKSLPEPIKSVSGLTPAEFTCTSTNPFSASLPVRPSTYIDARTDEIVSLVPSVLDTPATLLTLSAKFFLATAYDFFPSNDFLQNEHTNAHFLHAYKKWLYRELLGQPQPDSNYTEVERFQQLTELVQHQFRHVPDRSKRVKTRQCDTCTNNSCSECADSVISPGCVRCDDNSCDTCFYEIETPTHYSVLQKHYPTIKLSTVTKVFRSLGYTGHPRTSSRAYGTTMTELKAAAARYALQKVIDDSQGMWTPDPNPFTWNPVFNIDRKTVNPSTGPPDIDAELALLELEMAA